MTRTIVTRDDPRDMADPAQFYFKKMRGHDLLPDGHHFRAGIALTDGREAHGMGDTPGEALINLGRYLERHKIVDF